MEGRKEGRKEAVRRRQQAAEAVVRKGEKVMKEGRTQ